MRCERHPEPFCPCILLQEVLYAIPLDLLGYCRNTYKSLSKAGSLIPPAIGFVFDKEERTQQEINDLTRESGGSVAFLDRRCFENYLLHPRAIAEVLTKAAAHPIEEDAVCQWLDGNGNSRQYIDPIAQLGEGEMPWDSIDWLARVNAPKVLRDVFSAAPHNPEEYRKTFHSVAITDWLLQNSPECLHPIAELLKRCFDRSGRVEG